MRYLLGIAAIASALVLAGCNKKTESASQPTHSETTHEAHEENHSSASKSSTTTQKTAVADQTAKQGLARSAAPDEVVVAFLEATRSGDDQLASKLLSKKALEATTSAGLIVSPPGTPTMQYEIGEVEFPEHHPDGAYVKSIWHERFNDGEERFDVTWVLRKQKEGWRIVGMAMQLPGNDEPDLINFEAPDQLRQKLLEANAEPGAEGEQTEQFDEPSSEESEVVEESAELEEEPEQDERRAERLPAKRSSLR